MALLFIDRPLLGQERYFSPFSFYYKDFRNEDLHAWDKQPREGQADRQKMAMEAEAAAREAGLVTVRLGNRHLLK